jgi:hypothetical protein
MPTDCLTTLRRAVEEHVAPGTRLRTTALSLCIEAVAFAREDEPDAVAMRAGSASQLLLELTCPSLSPITVQELTAACERAAVRRP